MNDSRKLFSTFYGKANIIGAGSVSLAKLSLDI